MYVPINVQQGIPHSSYSHLNSNKHHHSLLMSAQHAELQYLCGFIFSRCKTSSYNFPLWVKAQGAERVRLDESRRKKPLPGDAEALCTAGGAAQLEKRPQRRGRIFYVSSQNIFCIVILNRISSSLHVNNFMFFSRKSRTICPQADLPPTFHRCFHRAYFFPAFSWYE